MSFSFEKLASHCLISCRWKRTIYESKFDLVGLLIFELVQVWNKHKTIFFCNLLQMASLNASLPLDLYLE